CGAGQVCDGASHCVTCLTAASCPGTDTQCQTRTCVSGSCGMSFAAVGTAVSGQVSGDCSKKQCNGTGMIVSVVDNTDPLVDNNPCTKDLCDNGQPSNPPLAARTNCGANLQCDGAGKCVTCLTTADCPGADTECQSRTCIAGACGIAFKAAGTPVSSQTAGDCKQNQCDGKGVVTTVVDDSDTQNDNNPCTDDLCSGGTSSHPNKAAKATCGTGLECDGAGHCVGCVADAECGVNTECLTFKCTNGTCGKTPTAAGTPVAAQTARDCNKNVCDGTVGNIVTVPDNSDLPVDGFTCTMDVCTAGAPSNPALPVGTACAQAGGTMCNGNGSCVQCITAADCGQNTECKTFTCTLGACGVANTPANTPLAGQVVGDCQKKVCDGAGNPTSIADDTDKPADSNVCTDDVCTNGTPTNPVVVDRTCNGNEFCKADGTCVACNTNIQCGADTECMKNTCVSNVCVHTPQTGVPLATQIPKNCRKETCDSNGAPLGSDPDDTDLPDDGNQCTQDLCNGGQIQHPFESTQKTCGTNGLCDGQGSCVGCNVDADCGVTNECESNTCDQGTKKCVKVFTPNHTATAAQVPGNCKKHVCNGSGQQVDDVDQSDVPVDGNVCTDDLCSADGTPSNPVLVDHTCAANGVCKSDGTCVGCNTDGQCGANTECRTNTCVNNSCSIATSPAAGTPLAAQTAKDCLKAVCDGLGGTTTIPDDSDKPVDGNDCTQDVCTNGVATNPALTVGTACSQNHGTRCNATPACVPAFAVVRVGDPATAPTSAATPVIVEIRAQSDGATIGNPISMPIATSGANKMLTLSGTGDSEGGLALSGDGRYLTLGGYVASVGTLSVKGTAATTNPRVVARIDAAVPANVDTSTTLGVIAFTKDNFRSVVTNDGTQFWAAGNGDKGPNKGVFYSSPIGATATTTQIVVDSGSTRDCEIANGQLFCTAANTPFNNVFQVGTNLPTTLQPLSALVSTPGMPTTDSTVSPFAFAWVGNVLYVADERAPPTGGVQKWTFNGSSWTLSGTFNVGLPATTGAVGLTADNSGGSTVLIVTSKATATTSPNTILRYVDDGIVDPASATATLLSTAPANTFYRGVALVPHP
ncbi:MAG TPA: hypothetical protein VNO55_06625, partial [Polyangia bacterium]|nr:hypothetical protein [Polyangia bacterium]